MTVPFIGQSMPRGWVCPGCGRCYSPFTAMCHYCPTRNYYAQTTDLPTAAELIQMAEDQQRIDNTPCPECGGDRLRTDFTGSGRCHAPRADS